jgi:hypothetical protein
MNAIIKTAMCLGGMLFLTSALAQPAAVKIVGVGSTSCRQFLLESRTTPTAQRDYLTWAQGFMSAVLLSRPAGVDEALDLNPPAFPIREQLAFLHDACEVAPATNFSDAVERLYEELRKRGK